MKTTKLLTLVIILQAFILLGQWLGTPRVTSAANAQIPDSGAIRLQILKEMETLNGKMEKMIRILESGKLEVRVVEADENKAGRAK